MVNFDEENKALIESLVALGILKTPRIIQAFIKIPRHLFIPEKYLPHAYSDIALPSLGDQTILFLTLVLALVGLLVFLLK